MKIPKTPFRLLKSFIDPEIFEEIEGDLIEQYREHRKKYSGLKSSYILWMSVFSTFRWSLIKINFSVPRFIPVKFLFLQSQRHLLKRKSDSLITSGSITIGLAFFLIIALFIRQEMSWDRFHQDYENVERVVIDFVFEDGDRIPDATTPPALKNVLKSDIPEVQYATRVFPSWGSKTLIQHGEKKFYEEQIIRTDSEFFKVFDFKLLKSVKPELLSEPNEIVLTESSAIKYFGKTDVLGEHLNFISGEDKTPYKITGIIEDVPLESHFNFDFLITHDLGEHENSWGWYNFYTYVRRKENTEELAFSNKLQAMYDEYNSVESNTGHIIYAQNIEDIHLHSHLKWELAENVNFQVIVIISILGCFVLLISIINFTNLRLSDAFTRHKEIGVKKVLGAKKSAILAQIGFDTFLLISISFIGAIFLAEFLSNQLIDTVGRKIEILNFSNVSTLAVTYLLILAICLIPTSIPALHLSSIKPVNAIKASIKDKKFGYSYLRGGLIVVQFSLSILMFIASYFIANQIDFIRTADRGFETEQLMIIPGAVAVSSQESFINELRKIKGVESAAYANGVIGKINWTTNLGVENSQLVNFSVIQPEFFETAGMKLKHGEFFNSEIKTQASGYHVVLNETAFNNMGLSVEDIGKDIPMTLSDDTIRKGKVIGVVENFRFMNFQSEYKPFAFFWREGEFDYLQVKLSSEKQKETIAGIEKLWNEFSDQNSMEYYFNDEVFERMLNSEKKLSKMSNYLAIISFVMAIVGMMSMLNLYIRSKLKEMAIRKVLGASYYEIYLLLGKTFLILTIISFALASISSFGLLNKWLEQYAERIDLNLFPYALFGTAAILSTLIILLIESKRLSAGNPVKYLKSDS